ncbi:hypothetical protein N7539_000803 [Penicillium diatomitis]|uniref:Uncharacterized protein n=1 Tax=Penicillium diatomitis TaxID=2819901 RepID=A0A9W9XMI2_9EURO|nr:uncharacterized protein N7539_000803 [Penicillium diatomitis]KAJ5495687.1 hypothetical protein N7539_000803 [Penicillium diatomitis]
MQQVTKNLSDTGSPSSAGESEVSELNRTNGLDVLGYAVVVTKREAALCDTSQENLAEMAVYGNIVVKRVESKWLSILASLYWRAVRQEAMCDILQALERRNVG